MVEKLLFFSNSNSNKSKYINIISITVEAHRLLEIRYNLQYISHNIVLNIIIIYP